MDEQDPWSKERLIEILHLAEELLGRQPGQVDFEPDKARRLGHMRRAEVSKALMDAGEWPCHKTFKNRFGSWNAAMEAAGYKPRRPGRPKRDSDAYSVEMG